MMFLCPSQVDMVLHIKRAPLRHPQCPFIQMTGTDVTVLPNYDDMDHDARSHVMILTSPPPLNHCLLHHAQCPSMLTINT
jgi:hypothetical protein